MSGLVLPPSSVTTFRRPDPPPASRLLGIAVGLDVNLGLRASIPGSIARRLSTFSGGWSRCT
jgi:hypothetical protein